MAWTDRRVALLRKLWREGASATEIAAVLGGVTRSAVLGKLHRGGWNRRTPRTVRLAPVPRATMRRRASDYKRAAAALPAPESGSLDFVVPFAARTRLQCAAIVDATRFAQRCCGAPVRVSGEEADVYCASHARLFRVARAKKRGRAS